MQPFKVLGSAACVQISILTFLINQKQSCVKYKWASVKYRTCPLMLSTFSFTT